MFLGFMYGYPVPAFNDENSCGKGVVTEECNFNGYLNRVIFANSKNFMMNPNDPEGLFSTLTSLNQNIYGLLLFTFDELQHSEERKQDRSVAVLGFTVDGSYFCWV